MSGNEVKNYSKAELAVTKRMSISTPLVNWHMTVEPVMLRMGYKGKFGQSNFLNDALRYYTAHCCEQEAIIKGANLVPTPEMFSDLQKALDDE